MNFLKKLFGRQQSEPSPESAEAAEEAFKVIDANLKKASVAEVGGFQPPDDPLSSWFGGHAVALPSESIPEYDGEPMFPLLQVNCSELPYVHPRLEGTALFVVWFCIDDFPFDNPHGEGWLIREYESLDELVPVKNIVKPKNLKTLPVRWTLVENDAPCWETSWDITDMSAVNDLENEVKGSNPFGDRYTNHWRTKIGGYPSEVQSAPETDAEFIFQIAAEEKANWDWVDTGVAHFFKDESGEWIWECQFS